jgi:hypothetical protein
MSAISVVGEYWHLGFKFVRALGLLSPQRIDDLWR